MFGNLVAKGICQGGVTFTHLAFIVVRASAIITDNKGKQHSKDVNFGINAFLTQHATSSYDLIIGDDTIGSLGITIAPSQPSDPTNRPDNRHRLNEGTVYSCLPHPLIRREALKLIQSSSTAQDVYNKAALTLSFRPFYCDTNSKNPSPL